MAEVAVSERLIEEAGRLLDHEAFLDHIAMEPYWNPEVSLRASPDVILQALMNRIRQMRKDLDQAI